MICAENRYPRRTVRSKIDPWRMYAQLKTLNGSPGSPSIQRVKQLMRLDTDDRGETVTYSAG